jgi:hypothetical protein
MSVKNEDTAAKSIVRKNERFYVPDQTENAPVENLADDDEIKGREQYICSPSPADTCYEYTQQIELVSLHDR